MGTNLRVFNMVMMQNVGNLARLNVSVSKWKTSKEKRLCCFVAFIWWDLLDTFSLVSVR